LVTAVIVDGLSVPSVANPSANQAEYQFYGIVFTGPSLVLGGLLIFLSRRRRARPAHAGEPPPQALQLTVVPGGDVGTMVAPRMPASMLWRVALFVVLAPLFSARWLINPTLAPWVLAGDCALAALMVLAYWLYLRNSRLFVDGQGLGRVDWFGRLTRFPRGSLVHAVRFSVANSYARNPYLSFVGHDGREVFRVSVAYWDSAQLDALCERAGLPVEGAYDDVVGALRMNRRVPGSLKWGRTIVVFVILLVVVVGIVVALDGPSPSTR
jgi:hypothetical protein